MNTLNSREGRRTCSAVWHAAKLFFQEQEDRSFTLKAELLPRCKRQKATAALIKAFQLVETCRLLYCL